MDTTPAKPRLREQFRNVIRVNHYSIRTEKTYWYWIRYFLRYHRMRHPLEMGPAEVSEFLTWLAVSRHGRRHAESGAQCSGVSLRQGA
ncbi:site-specific integrase [Halopseudomonas pachastrellae]|nr:site-specific integrase [Halopseudomonas pachastrellae]